MCPNCGKPAVKRSEFPPRNDPNAAPGFYCYDKAGGSARSSAPTIRASRNSRLGNVVDPDPADQLNTILKMAKKRALIAEC